MSKEMMEVLDDVRLEGIERGRTIGIEQGRTMGIEQGKTMGLEQGKVKVAVDLYKRKLIDLETAAEVLNMSKDEFLKLV